MALIILTLTLKPPTKKNVKKNKAVKNWGMYISITEYILIMVWPF